MLGVCAKECGDNPENEAGRGQVIQGSPSYEKAFGILF